MDLLLSRILTYLNSSLADDNYYRFCKFLVNNYLVLEDLDFNEIILKSEIDRKDIINFCTLLGFKNYEEFKEQLLRDYVLRVDQIRARMLGINSDWIINKMGNEYFDKDIQQTISKLCNKIFKAKKVVLVGGLYPMSIAVELQTDLVTFGKPVYQYHEFDKKMIIEADDVVIFISATGRSMKSFMKIKNTLNINDAYSILITQNKIYTLDQYKIANDVILVPGKFDGIEFNHQIMTICDLIRVCYYQQYYL